MAIPAYGYDAALPTDDSAELQIAARTGQEVYNYIIAWCATKDVLLSIDGGTSYQIPVGAGLAPMRVDVGRRQGAIYGKNAVAGQDAITLYVIIGYDPSKG